MNKRVYVPPKIFRVKLNHEQAVLSQCSSSAGSLRDTRTTGGCSTDMGGCRQKRDFRNADFGFSS